MTDGAETRQVPRYEFGLRTRRRRRRPNAKSRRVLAPMGRKLTHRAVALERHIKMSRSPLRRAPARIPGGRPMPTGPDATRVPERRDCFLQRD